MTTAATTDIATFINRWGKSGAAERANSQGFLYDLRGVIEREEAAIGVFLCIEKPTKAMLAEAADAGIFQTRSVAGTTHPRLQILTIEDLLNGKRIDMAAQQEVRSCKQAPKAKVRKPEQARLF